MPPPVGAIGVGKKEVGECHVSPPKSDPLHRLNTSVWGDVF